MLECARGCAPRSRRNQQENLDADERYSEHELRNEALEEQNGDSQYVAQIFLRRPNEFIHDFRPAHDGYRSARAKYLSQLPSEERLAASRMPVKQQSPDRLYSQLHQKRRGRREGCPHSTLDLGENAVETPDAERGSSKGRTRPGARDQLRGYGGRENIIMSSIDGDAVNADVTVVTIAPYILTR